MNNSGKIIFAVAAGVAVGAVAGILFAPTKGSETRRKITETIRNRINGCKESCNDLKEDIEQQVKESAQKFST